MSKWTRFEFASGSNPYIAKTEEEKERILKKYNCLFIEEEKDNYFILDKLLYELDEEDKQDIIDEVDEILTSYTEDEAGKMQKKQYEDMVDFDKVLLFYNALNCSDRIRDYYDFKTDIVINFDYGNY